jgi:hypothetical protein
MQRIARSTLLNLSQERFRVTYEEIAHGFMRSKLGMQVFDFASKQPTAKLHEAAVEGHPAVHRCEQSERTFAPDIRGFDCVAVFQNRKQGQDATFREIGVSKHATGFAYYVAKLERGNLEIGLNTPANGRM